MADEDTVLEEAMEYLKEAGQRIRATQSLMRSQGPSNQVSASGRRECLLAPPISCAWQ
jgi:hypothetical protein